MPRFADQTISEFLDALSSPNPTPGGGTAAAVCGSIAVALLIMVASLTKSKSNTDRERAALSEARTALEPSKQRLLALADTDSAAFDHVMEAYRLPKSTDDEKTRRKQVIQRALQGATETPLETLRAMADAVEPAPVVAQFGNRAATSDIRVALELLEASSAGAAANVEINLTSLDDDAYKKAVAADVLALTNRIKERTANARAALAATVGS